MDDSNSDRNELSKDGPPDEFLLSWIEFIEWKGSSSNSYFFLN